MGDFHVSIELTEEAKQLDSDFLAKVFAEIIADRLRNDYGHDMQDNGLLQGKRSE